MKRANAYVLKQLLTLFGFFALILVLIYWVNRAVSLFDQLIADGQSIFIFLEFTSLTLPWIIQMVTPAAGFAAVVYVVHRLSIDSELVILQTSGRSNCQIATPVWIFALCVTLITLVLYNVLVPISQSRLQQRQTEVAENVTARLLTEGAFLKPNENITFYLKSISNDGQLESVFLNSTIDPKRNVTYSATKAFLVRSDIGPQLVLIDGLVQSLDIKTQRLTVTRFNDFVVNIGRLITPSDEIGFNASNFTSVQLLKFLRGTKVLPGSISLQQIRLILHTRITAPLLSIFGVLLGYAVLISSGFSRFGIWKHVLLAVLSLSVLKIFEGICIDYVGREKNAVWVLYMPLLFGFLCTYAILFTGDKPWRTSEGSTI